MSASHINPKQENSRSIIIIVITVIKYLVFTAIGVLSALIIIGLGGYQIPFWPEDTEVTNEELYSNFIGKEYRVTSPIHAVAWNDHPNKDKILTVSLSPPPGVHNRFVSYSITLQPGQNIHIISAWRSLSLFEYSYYYLISIPGAGLPEGVPIKMRIGPEGIPSPLYFESMQSNNSLVRDSSLRSAAPHNSGDSIQIKSELARN